MIQYVINDGPYSYQRISKARARKLHASGADVFICLHKLRPGGPWAESGRLWLNERSFDSQVDDFVDYHCPHKTGYYPAFYIMVDHRGKLDKEV